MKKAIILLFVIHLCAFTNAQSQKKESKYFQNPIFAGDYPDPNILRDGSDYYIVHSSFDYYPGLLIWHSRDLINWEPVTHALTKNVGSVWAPDLVKFKGKFYIYFPANGTNYVVTADAISGPWSDPVDLKIGNIDPGHVVDQNGKRYLYFSGGGYAPLSDDGLTVTGKINYVYGGWPIPKEWSIECFCMEGPKLMKHGEYYYLTVAEGGTAGPPTSHMVVSARSKSPFGPWENSPYNPIIHTGSGAERWWSKGHGTLVEDVKGKWWIVFHGYDKGHYNMGRQTLLEPVEWTADGWFKTPEGTKTDGPMIKPAGMPLSKKFNLSDGFAAKKLGLQWQFFKEYDTSRFKLTDGSLIINGKGSTAGDSSPLLCIPSDHSYTAQVEMTIEGNATGGLILFYDEKSCAGIVADKKDIFSLRLTSKDKVGTSKSSHIFLKLKNIENVLDMYYSFDGTNWVKSERSAEVSSFNHNILQGFLGLRVGLCAFGNGDVKFKNFRYLKTK